MVMKHDDGDDSDNGKENDDSDDDVAHIMSNVESFSFNLSLVVILTYFIFQDLASAERARKTVERERDELQEELAAISGQR